MNQRFLAWPGWPFLRFAWLLSAANGVWFVFVYGGSDWLTAHRSLRVPIHLPIELSIPLIPSAVLVYMSIYVLFLVGPFIVRDRREFAGLICALAFATLVGGVGFLLVPSRAAFAPPGDLGIWTSLFNFADRLNLDYNMVPSLHVAFFVCCIAAFVRHASPPGRALLWTWAAAIALSTLLTHQHHVVDVISGWAVGIVSYRVARFWIGKWRSSDLVTSTSAL
jgi:membrane-associated phospholipid phosphatase